MIPRKSGHAEIFPSAAALFPERAWRVTVGITLVLYFFIQLLYVTATPLQVRTLPDNLPQNGPQRLTVGIGPDESEHFIYILSLEERGAIPKPAARWRTGPDQYVSYQAQHPPLFYFVAALLYRAVRSLSPAVIWFILRGFCALCGGVVVVLTAWAARTAFPHQPLVVFASAPFIAFLPMFGHMMGNLSNEPLAMVFTAAAWFQMVRLARGVRPLTLGSGALLGLTLGLAAETRLTAVMWLPAAFIVLVFCARKQSPAALTPILTFLVCFLGLTCPWFLYNHAAYGTFVLRPYDRPMLQGQSLLLFLFSPGFPLVALITLFSYVSTAWSPFWLTKSYWPGGVSSQAPWQTVFLVLDLSALLALILHSARMKRAGGSPDAVGRVLLWAAAGTVGACVLILLQQQLYSDWDVAVSPGRYLVAAAPASALLFLFACSTCFRCTKRALCGAMALTVLMLGFDLYSASLVRHFYAEHPVQDAVQRL